MPETGLEMRIRKDDLAEVETLGVPVPEPAAGEAVLRVGPFAFTANNVTYAVAGDMLSYWGLFAAPEGWGRIPVWGFADVIASAAPGLEVGERLYGYLPMSTHLLIKPDRLTKAALFDANPARKGPHDLYHQYTRCAADPAYDKDYEAEQALFRPLFTTSFVIDDFVARNEAFGAKHVILGSASSKTALGAAFLLSRRSGRSYSVVGLTSPGNRTFVESLGYYDTVLTYDEVSKLPKEPAAFIDMSGSAAIVRAVHEHFGDALKKSSTVGITHWGERGDTSNMPGPEPEMFFAPTIIAERMEEWGTAGFQSRLGEAWDSFIKPRVEWLTIIDSRGPMAVERAYRRVLRGEAHPSEGHMMTLWED